MFDRIRPTILKKEKEICMNTYENLKKVIAFGRKEKEEVLVMMDVFLMNNRISKEQYAELVTLLG